MKEYTWEDIVKECERLLQMNGHARSPVDANLPNVIRDLVFKVCGSPTASQPDESADTKKKKEVDWSRLSHAAKARMKTRR